jgi:hypothetical protein
MDRALVHPGVHHCALVRLVACQTLGPGPGAALRIGFWVGLIAGFPGNFAQPTWSAADRVLPFGWMLEMWIGAILASMFAGWLYKD